MIEAVDHIALSAISFEDRITFFTQMLGLQVRRMGVHYATGKRIALLADRKGFKIELIEAPSEPQTLKHVALRVDDVALEYEHLLRSGCISIRGPHDLAASKAVTALLQEPSGSQIQIIKYRQDSPDL
jgi:catechol 2,3-dioxygenase-like lactoylglutathione lyase family enzyme